jgi:hypothetical protein
MSMLLATAAARASAFFVASTAVILPCTLMFTKTVGPWTTKNFWYVSLLRLEPWHTTARTCESKFQFHQKKCSNSKLAFSVH